MKTSLVSRGNWLFWGLFCFLLILMFPFFKDGFYSDESVMSWVEKFKKPVVDTTNVRKDDDSLKKDVLDIQWAWIDFNRNQNSITFKILKEDYQKAITTRESLDFWSATEVYRSLMEVSSGPLDSMANAMKRDIQQKNLSGISAMNYVVNAIQFPRYTKVANDNECPCNDNGQFYTDDCNPREDGSGCCNNVKPFAVYSPTEFIVQKTGDCDTKSLIAFGLLSRMGYDVAVLIGQIPAHAMLGVANMRPDVVTKYVSYNGQIYFPWEVTAFADHCVLGNMSMWNPWVNWEVAIRN
jgi:hypothetical protein